MKNSCRKKRYVSNKKKKEKKKLHRGRFRSTFFNEKNLSMLVDHRAVCKKQLILDINLEYVYKYIYSTR